MRVLIICILFTTQYNENIHSEGHIIEHTDLSTKSGGNTGGKSTFNTTTEMSLSKVPNPQLRHSIKGQPTAPGVFTAVCVHLG